MIEGVMNGSPFSVTYNEDDRLLSFNAEQVIEQAAQTSIVIMNLVDPSGNLACGGLCVAGLVVGGTALVALVVENVEKERIQSAQEASERNKAENGTPNIPGINLPMEAPYKCPRGAAGNTVNCFNPPNIKEVDDDSKKCRNKLM